MQAVFYSNFNKRRRSTKQPTGGGSTKDIKLKGNCSIKTPVFILNEVNYSYNYCLWNGRYYFVDDVIAVNNDMAEYHCIFDEMATFKTEIGSYVAYVERAASSYDLMINDNLISQKQNIVAQHTAATTFEDDIQYEPDDGAFFIRIINNQSSNITGIATYVVDKNNFAAIISDICSLTSYTEGFFDPSSLYSDLCKALFNPAQYIVDCYWLPVYAGVMSTTKPLVSGFYNVGDEYLVADKTGHTFDIEIEIPQNHYSDFRGYNSRWTNMSIWIPGIGQFEVDPINLSGGATLKVILSLDYTTGDVIAQLVRNNTHQITTKYGSWKVPIQIGKGGSVIGGLAKDVLSVGSSLAMGNLAGAVTETFSSISDLFTPPANATGGVGSRQQFTAQFGSIFTTITNYDSAEIATKELGRPVYKNVAINTLSGYVKCANASISLPADASEIDAVNAALNNGFYYE